MENNAYKEKNIEINGKEIVIPEVLTFAQMINCELKGLSLNDVQKKPLFALTVIFSEIVKCPVDNAATMINQLIEGGNSVSELLIDILPSYANFFAQNSNKE